MTRTPAFATRLIWAMAALLLAFGLLVGVLVHVSAGEREQESLQRLSHGLARHIVEHWPEITKADPRDTDQAARDALLSMLMVVNPGIQVYLLGADGRVNAYLGEPGMVRQQQVELAPVRAFLSGAALPVQGTDPMGSGVGRIFSAAMFPRRAGDDKPPGYLYVVLDGQTRDQLAGEPSLRGVWLRAGLAGLGALVFVALLGMFIFRRMTQPLRRLACAMHAYQLHPPPTPERMPAPPERLARGDEVRAIADAFADMRERITAQNAYAHRQTLAHQEMMASVAHDLRTPLTALHGHLEMLASDTPVAPRMRDRLLQAALAQSNKVRRLSQQLFELAALQSSDQVLHREVFRLDELVADAVRKFELSRSPPPVTLAGESEELARRLRDGQSMRDPPAIRVQGGIGGLGLAIAQRVAVMHGGSLRPLLSAQGGGRRCAWRCRWQSDGSRDQRRGLPIVAAGDACPASPPRLISGQFVNPAFCRQACTPVRVRKPRNGKARDAGAHALQCSRVPALQLDKTGKSPPSGRWKVP
jgi:signal transduction histidine kinase